MAARADRFTGHGSQQSGQQTYEHDPRWEAVDHYACARLLGTPPSDGTTPDYGEALQFAADLSAKQDLPNIEVSPLQGQFLALQCMATGARHALEVGTLGGYSSIWLASASPAIKVTTVEVVPHHKQVAEEAIAHAGLGDRIEVLLGAGVDVLPKIQHEITEGQRDKFGFVFIDADKPNNLAYLNAVVPMCLPRAVIVVDNVVRRGALADPASTDPKVIGSRQVVEAAGRDGRLQCSLLQTVGEKNYDGFLICVVK